MWQEAGVLEDVHDFTKIHSDCTEEEEDVQLYFSSVGAVRSQLSGLDGTHRQIEVAILARGG